MKKGKIVSSPPTEPIRKICGDCYYNGYCKKKIKDCEYLKEKDENEK